MKGLDVINWFMYGHELHIYYLQDQWLSGSFGRLQYVLVWSI